MAAENYIVKIQRENEALKLALSRLLLRDLPRVADSRLEKLRKNPTPGGMDAQDLGYKTCAEEVSRLIDVAIGSARDETSSIDLPSLEEIIEIDLGPVTFEKRSHFDEVKGETIYVPAPSRWNDFKVGDAVTRKDRGGRLGRVVSKTREPIEGRTTRPSISVNWSSYGDDRDVYEAGEWMLEKAGEEGTLQKAEKAPKARV